MIGATTRPTATRPPEAKPKPKNFLEAIAPDWAGATNEWFRDQKEVAWRTVQIGTGAIIFLFGMFLLIGGGYLSIQGARLLLSLLGVPINMRDFPELTWWLLPLGMGFIQILSKPVPMFRSTVWRVSVAFDAGTTAAYLGMRIRAGFYAIRPDIHEFGGHVLAAAAGAALGCLSAIVAERAVTAGLLLMVEGIRDASASK